MLGLALIALPLLLVTLGVLLVVLISSCSSTTTRRAHSRKLIHDLTEYARVLRSRR